MTKLQLIEALDINRYEQNKLVAITSSGAIHYQQFLNDVYHLSEQLKRYSLARWAIFEPCSYRFAVGLFALLAAQKSIVIPGDNNLSTQTNLAHFADHLIGDFPQADVSIGIQTPIKETPAFSTKDFKHSHITIFTSGSTGKPKAIVKTIAQLEAEVNGLESLFGVKMAKADVFSTVSHQHIYGLLFKLLWPICGERAFYSQQAIDFKDVFSLTAQSQTPLVWVSSPAHLKRLQEGSPWHSARQKWTMVFSSGGPLPFSAAQQLKKFAGSLPYEIYGSSETGGIAYRRQQTEKQLWLPLPKVKIRQSTDSRLALQSPYLPDNEWFISNDKVEIKEQGFLLIGRTDRIVKLEEKRLSLPALEAAINLSDLIEESYAVVLAPQEGRIRQTLAVACVLSSNGNIYLDQHGHAVLIKTMKLFLRDYFETSLIPRKWRFTAQLPTNTQSKINKQDVMELFDA